MLNNSPKNIIDMLVEFRVDDKVLYEELFLNEMGVNSVKRILFSTKTAVISAYLGGMSKNEKERRTSEMVRDIQALGLKAFPQSGFWEDDPREVSFVIPNMPWSDAVKLTKKYQQVAIIYSLGDGIVSMPNFKEGKVYWATQIGSKIYGDQRSREERRANAPGRPPSQMRGVSIDLNFGDHWDKATPFTGSIPKPPPEIIAANSLSAMAAR